MIKTLSKSILVLTSLPLVVFSIPVDKSINLKKNKITHLTPSYFYNIKTGTENRDFPTNISIVAEDDGFRIKFINDGSCFVYQNNIFKNNSDLYKQEVFEVFIHSGAEISSEYFEFEVNPNSALFNTYIKKAGKEATYLDVSNTDTGFTNTTSYNDVSWLVAKDIKKGSYTGKLYIPYSLVGKSDTYRINFFRIASNMSHSVTDWRCDMATCSYLAYNPTYNTTFHVPDKMVILKVSE